jgi:hypothetical protein
MSAAALVLLLGVPRGAGAQADPFSFKFNAGQNIQPIFEGWSRHPDGGFSMHFGYLNRNYVEELQVPIGPDNNIQPGGPDRGQPTFFYTRINRNLFTVTVPKDWGLKDEMVWTLTVRGKTEKAIGWLHPEWEIDPIGGAALGGRMTEERAKNKPPTIAVDAPQSTTITLPNALALNVTVTDDGIPKPRSGEARQSVGQETPPTLQAPPGTPDAPVNVPQVQPAGGGGGGGRQRPQGLRVSWMVWRGPGGVTFDPRSSAVKQGKAATTAKFAKPGTYVLRATANDGMMSTVQEVTVTVNAAR